MPTAEAASEASHRQRAAKLSEEQPPEPEPDAEPEPDEEARGGDEGTIAGLLANGADPLDAASVGAHVHGRAGTSGPTHGVIATDVIDALPSTLTRLAGGR